MLYSIQVCDFSAASPISRILQNYQCPTIEHLDKQSGIERGGQKAIVIGDKGQRIKQVGMDARKDMEQLFDKKIMLTLWVKVKRGWSDDERALTSLGY